MPQDLLPTSNDPDKAMSGAKQTISPETFTEMIRVLRLIGQGVNMHVGVSFTA